MTRVTAPALDDRKQLTSATVYGQHLYVAETPISDVGVLTLHATDVNALLAMKDDDTPHWAKHSIALDQSIKDHVNDMSRASVNFQHKSVKSNMYTYYVVSNGFLHSIFTVYSSTCTQTIKGLQCNYVHLSHACVSTLAWLQLLKLHVHV